MRFLSLSFLLPPPPFFWSPSSSFGARGKPRVRARKNQNGGKKGEKPRDARDEEALDH